MPFRPVSILGRYGTIEISIIIIIIIQRGPKKMTQLVFVKTSSNLHQIW